MGVDCILDYFDYEKKRDFFNKVLPHNLIKEILCVMLQLSDYTVLPYGYEMTLSGLAQKFKEISKTRTGTIRRIRNSPDLLVYDEKTEGAVRFFQSAANLPETGSVDYATFISLRRSDIKPQKMPSKAQGIPPKSPLSDVQEPTPPRGATRDFKKDLSYLNFRNPGGFAGIKDDTLKFLYIINDLAKEEGIKITITSMYRGPYDQARIMLNITLIYKI